MGEYALMPYQKGKRNYGNFVRKLIFGQCKKEGTYTAKMGSWGGEAMGGCSFWRFSY
jgi:hypothetical protein